MRKSFNLPSWGALTASGPRFWLQAAAVGLLVLNCVALFFYLAPPGGTQKELQAESENLRVQTATAARNTARLRNIASKVQSGGGQASLFAQQYFLPRREAYDEVLTELQRMAAASGAQAREAVYNEEAVEGSADLSVMNITGNFEGTYPNLMRFLYQVDKSPLLLMLDTLQVAPQQHGDQVNSSMRFQAIVQDDAAALLGGQR